jgi:polyhydroxyalkanoate synthase
MLFVPPLAAPASCFDLRPGCSIAEHLVERGHPTYLVDYGPISFGDRALGLEHWVFDVIPEAARIVAEDSGTDGVHTLGWSLGGVMALLTAAADRKLPIATITMVGSPFDFESMSMGEPIRRLARLTGGQLISGLNRALGGAPATLTSLGFRLTAIDRILTKPLFLAENVLDSERLAHAQAVDEYMRNMFAYPGRSFGQLYHTFFLVNELYDGRTTLNGRKIDVGEVRQPVLVIAGEDDVLAPLAAVQHVGGLLRNSVEMRLEKVPGGHLGILTGTSARRTTWRLLDEFLDAHDPEA